MTGATNLTGADFDRLPYEEGRRWELVGGELIRMSSPTPEHQRILQNILFALMLYFRENPSLGEVYTDVEFALSAEHRVRPDVLVLGAARAARLNRKAIPIVGAPDLAVEIISPSERKGESEEKLAAYLRFGTGEVWHVYPESRTLVVYRDGGSERFETGSAGSALLPGFVLDIRWIFE